MSEPSNEHNRTSISVVVAYHSGYGHTARQPRAVADGVASVAGARVELRNVAELTESLWHALDSADAIVFGSPTYMGSQSSTFQAFAEASASVWAKQGWRNKLAAGFTTSAGANGDKLHTLSSMVLFAAQHGMTWVNLDLAPGWIYTSTGTADSLNRLGGFVGAMAQAPSDAPPDVAPPSADLRTAEHLGRRVALLARQFAIGKRSIDDNIPAVAVSA